MSASKCIKSTNRSESTLRGLVLVIALATLLVPVAAWADSVLLDEGTVQIKGPAYVVNVSGPDFSLFAVASLLAMRPNCPCAPGSLFNPDTGELGPDQGIVRYAGISATVFFTPGPGEPFIGWSVDADPFILPAQSGNSLTITEPFSISLFASIPPCPTCPRSISVNATGTGVATFSFAPSNIFPGGQWGLTSAVYEIIPAPEPATWLLVPTAVGLGWLARKKRKAT